MKFRVFDTKTNLYGPIVLFQATHSLLRKSANPKFIPISSQAASIDGITVRSAAVGATGYGSSKAALNWVTRKIHFENDWLTTFLISPGMVYTDMCELTESILLSVCVSSSITLQSSF